MKRGHFCQTVATTKSNKINDRTIQGALFSTKIHLVKSSVTRLRIPAPASGWSYHVLLYSVLLLRFRINTFFFRLARHVFINVRRVFTIMSRVKYIAPFPKRHGLAGFFSFRLITAQTMTAVTTLNVPG